MARGNLIFFLESNTGGNVVTKKKWDFLVQNYESQLQFLGLGLSTLKMAYEQHFNCVRGFRVEKQWILLMFEGHVSLALILRPSNRVI